jgi:hypothetical protein
MRPEDAGEILEIKRQVFGERRAERELWLHLRYGQPWGALPGVVYTIDGKIAGTLSTISRKLKIGGRTTLSAQHVDAMVLPEARGQSFYKKMVKQASQLDREAGAGLVYGLPNKLSEPRLLSPDMGWLGAFNVPAYARVVRPELVAQVAPDLPYGLGLLARPGLEAVRLAQALPLRVGGLLPATWTEGAPEDTDDLWERAAKASPVQTVRDSEYLRWRYDQNPGGRFDYVRVRDGGRLQGLAVVTEQEFRGLQALIVMDWLVAPGVPRVFESLLAAVQREAQRLRDVSLVLLFALPPYGGQAARMGFWRIPERALPTKIYLCFEAGQRDEREERALASPRNWQMTFGDSDLV